MNIREDSGHNEKTSWAGVLSSTADQHHHHHHHEQPYQQEEPQVVEKGKTQEKHSNDNNGGIHIKPPAANTDLVTHLSAREQVDMLAQALLREFMHRRGYTKTLQAFDHECPRNERTIASRQLMRQLLEIPSNAFPSRLSGDTSVVGTSAGSTGADHGAHQGSEKDGMNGSSMNEKKKKKTKKVAPTFMEELCSYRLQKREIQQKQEEAAKAAGSGDATDVIVDPSDAEMEEWRTAAAAAERRVAEAKERQEERLREKHEKKQRRRDKLKKNPEKEKRKKDHHHQRHGKRGDEQGEERLFRYSSRNKEVGDEEHGVGVGGVSSSTSPLFRHRKRRVHFDESHSNSDEDSNTMMMTHRKNIACPSSNSSSNDNKTGSLTSSGTHSTDGSRGGGGGGGGDSSDSDSGNSSNSNGMPDHRHGNMRSGSNKTNNTVGNCGIGSSGGGGVLAEPSFLLAAHERRPVGQAVGSRWTPNGGLPAEVGLGRTHNTNMNTIGTGTVSTSTDIPTTSNSITVDVERPPAFLVGDDMSRLSERMYAARRQQLNDWQSPTPGATKSIAEVNSHGRYGSGSLRGSAGYSPAATAPLPLPCSRKGTSAVSLPFGHIAIGQRCGGGGGSTTRAAFHSHCAPTSTSSPAAAPPPPSAGILKSSNESRGYDRTARPAGSALRQGSAFNTNGTNKGRSTGGSDGGNNNNSTPPATDGGGGGSTGNNKNNGTGDRGQSTGRKNRKVTILLD